MKQIAVLIAAVIAVLGASQALAETRCSKDYFGNVT